MFSLKLSLKKETILELSIDQL
ncbi:MAG: class I lanthipeptide [Candidatus Hermodarchaeota archaeon]